MNHPTPNDPFYFTGTDQVEKDYLLIAMKGDVCLGIKFFYDITTEEFNGVFPEGHSAIVVGFRIRSCHRNDVFVTNSADSSGTVTTLKTGKILTEAFPNLEFQKVADTRASYMLGGRFLYDLEDKEDFITKLTELFEKSEVHGDILEKIKDSDWVATASMFGRFIQTNMDSLTRQIFPSENKNTGDDDPTNVTTLH